MDQLSSSQSPQQQETTVNPIVAVGRKVKSVLTTTQRPSVRIYRQHASTAEPRQERASQGIARKPVPAALGSSEKALPPLPPPNGNEPATTNRFTATRNRAGSAIKSLFSRGDIDHDSEDESYEREYDPDTVDLMDVMDPEVSTLATLTNIQNSLFVPQLGGLVNRRATYRVQESPEETKLMDRIKSSLKRIGNFGKNEEEKKKAAGPMPNAEYAVLPDDEILEGWTAKDKEELDDLVRHMLHSRRAKFKRALKGFGQYVRRPLGLFITVYATLITLFGAAWVFFLIGWISLGSKQDYVVNIVDNVLVALFAIIGDGLAPFRAVDTYHMIYIAHYHRLTWKKREKLGLPELVDHNDLPENRKEDVEAPKVDLESLVARKMPNGLARRMTPYIPKSLGHRWISRYEAKEPPSYDYSVLTPEQQEKLEFHERKFSKSHTFYKPHETETHYAFPLKLLIAVVVLLDLHSCLQISLGACTWGINYHTRPFALTTVILCCSITCNIMGGVLISIGDKRTRKVAVIERLERQELTRECIETMETRWMKEAEARGEVPREVRKRYEEARDQEETEDIKRSWKSVPSLPKHLLGKGADHRQPALPQKERRSASNAGLPDSAASSSSNLSKSKEKGRSGTGLPSVQEGTAPPQPVKPNPALLRGKEAPKEGKAQRALKFIRRADLDKS